MLDITTSQVEELKDWFSQYVQRFKNNDEEIKKNVALKEYHTVNVCKNIVAIGKAIHPDKPHLLLAESIALLHDIGRFEQYQEYRTFMDRKSIDHAELGVDILKRNQAIELELSNSPEISDCVYQDVLHKRTVDFKNLRTINDFKLVQVGWVFDINFVPTLSLLRKRRYMDIMREVLPKTEKINRVFRIVDSHISSRKET